MEKIKRKKILSVLIILVLSTVVFATGALCTNCGSDQDDTKKIGVETDSKIETSEAEEEEPEETDEDEINPIIELKIYEGPLYSEPDDICFYRVEAILEGFEEPIEIKFSKDDSNSAWGKNKAQVNLERGEKYTLIVTASDKENTEVSTLDLEWACDEDTPEGQLTVNSPPFITGIIIPNEDIIINSTIDIAAVVVDPEGDEIAYKWSAQAGSFSDDTRMVTKWSLPSSPGVYELALEVTDSEGNISDAVKEVTVKGPASIVVKEKTVIPQQTGSISDDGFVNTSQVFIGHSSDGKDYQGYISFDITDLYDKEIVSARLIMDSGGSWDPRSGFGSLMLGTIDYGGADLNSSVNARASELIANMQYNTSSIDISSQSLIVAIEKRISQGSSRFQFKIYYQYPKAYTGTGPNGISFNNGNISLSVGYKG